MNLLFSVTFIITCLGAILWGLIGIGGFAGKNINVIAFVSQGKTAVEYAIYLVIGISAVVHVWLSSRQ